MPDFAIAKNLSDMDFIEDVVAKSRAQVEQRTRIERARQHAVEFTTSHSTGVSITYHYPLSPNNRDLLNLNYGVDIPETAAQAISNAIKRLYLNQSSLRDRRIAERLITLYRDALAENEKIQTRSVKQLADFLINHAWVGFPKITLTPDGTLRARWIAGPGNFTAIEFTGTALVKLVAEVPRGDTTAQYFASELMANIARIALNLGAPFA